MLLLWDDNEFYTATYFSLKSRTLIFEASYHYAHSALRTMYHNSYFDT